MISDELDTILAIQFVVAWAGECGNPRHPRLGWWQTDAIDAAGGGDYFARLLPRTHAWAALQVVRDAARQTDRNARRKLGNPDAMRSLFFLGSKLDEQLAERLLEHKLAHHHEQGPVPLPHHVLPALSACMQSAVLDLDALRRAFSDAATAGSYPGFDVAPGARQLRGEWPGSALLGVKHLARALLTEPVPTVYPMPFYALSEAR